VAPSSVTVGALVQVEPAVGRGGHVCPRKTPGAACQRALGTASSMTPARVAEPAAMLVMAARQPVRPAGAHGARLGGDRGPLAQPSGVAGKFARRGRRPRMKPAMTAATAMVVVAGHSPVGAGRSSCRGAARWRSGGNAGGIHGHRPSGVQALCPPHHETSGAR
jgi:hypothetical protein